jgi:hypothetical protein
MMNQKLTLPIIHKLVLVSLYILDTDHVSLILYNNPLVIANTASYKIALLSSQVRDFRGAFLGESKQRHYHYHRYFHTRGKKEAVREGVPPIELVHEEKLLDMFFCINFQI